MSEILSYRATIQVLRDFMDVAFPMILYLRQVYPAQLFERRKKYGVPVWASRNPVLNQYIGGVVEAIAQELIKGTLRKVVLVIREATIEEEPLERFIFDFDWLISTDRVGEANSLDFTPATGGILRAHVDDHLRGFLQKLNTAESYLLQLPPDITFTIVIELTDDAAPPETRKSRDEIEPAQWIPAEARIASREGGGVDDDMIDDEPIRSLTPLRTARLGIINVQLLVEELSGKLVYAKQQNPIDVKGKGRAV